MHPIHKRSAITAMVLVGVALVIGVLGMQFLSSGLGTSVTGDSLTGLAVSTMEEPENGGIALLLIGIGAGACVIGALVYLYHAEKR